MANLIVCVDHFSEFIIILRILLLLRVDHNEKRNRKGKIERRQRDRDR